MASQCKKQQCTIDRRGFRQELDSWRHKLIHCVGFESILEGLFGTELVEDLQLFKDLEPVAVSDWSFDKKCLFCCFRRDKVKEHLIGLSSEESQDPLKPLVVKDQTTISKLEKQAEEFLNAVLCNKDVPSFSDPHIPVVAREILQKMIRQFAAEYTSKTSSPQDSDSAPQPSADQSLQTPDVTPGASPSSPAATVAGPAHSHNPVLSKLLMADQEAPLDLTIKKTPSEPSEQEGVLDLSIKKSRNCGSSLPVPSQRLTPKLSAIKGECQDVRIAKVKELQSTSTLEQFMAKLCRHHQRTIVDAIGFLQKEVATSKTRQSSDTGIQGETSSTPKPGTVTPEKFLSRSTPKFEVLDMSCSIQSCSVTERNPQTVVPLTSVGVCSKVDLHSPGSRSTQVHIPMNAENNRNGDHAPLKMKIMKSSNVAAGKKLSCVLTTSLTSDSDSLEDKQSNSNSLNTMNTRSARLSSSLKRQYQLSQMHHARQSRAAWKAEGVPPKQCSADLPRTARKTIRPSAHQPPRHSPYRTVDPDLGHCDIVYIDKPITECFKDKHNLIPRRNARKSTRGHLYSDEIWELKTVRTLAGRGNLNSMPELITLVTPKQMLSKPEGVPPIDVPFASACREIISEGTCSEQTVEMIVPGTGDIVEVAAGEVETVVVETSQTDQVLSQLETPVPKTYSVTEKTVKDGTTNIRTDVESYQLKHDQPSESEEQVPRASFEEATQEENEPEPEKNESTGKVMSETAVEQSGKNNEQVESQISCANMQTSELVTLHITTPSPMTYPENQETEKAIGNERSQEPHQNIHSENRQNTRKSNNSGSADQIKSELEIPSATVKSVEPVATVEQDDTYDISSKTLDTLLKELPPWRRKKGTVISLPKRLQQAKTIIVGYVNGRPVSASDRSLRRRSNSSSTSPVKQTQKVLKQDEVDSTETNLENNFPETEMPKESIVSTSECPQVSASDIPESPTIKPLRKSNPTHHHKLVQQDEPTETKRQLRSTVQKPDETLAPSSNVVPSISPPKPAPPALYPFCPSPLVESLPPVPPEPSQMSIVPNTPVILNIEQTQSIEETPSLLVRQKLRSSKMGGKESKNENQQLGVESSSPMEDQASHKTEMSTTETRGKRVLRMEPMTQNANVPPSVDNSGSSHLNSTCRVDKPTRMPLRSESSKAEQSPLPAPQSPPDNKKLSLRSRLSSPFPGLVSASVKNTEVASLTRTSPEKITRTQMKGASLSTVSSIAPVMGPRHQPRKQINKFLETLTGEENKQLLTNLNLKYDKMQKGWLQMERDGQTTAKYKNKADRQAAIWKSKRRARKPKSLEHQKCSPVQLLFMKDYKLSSICRWFLESTETKSLIIVKKVNTRLPSETQLCFHSSSSGSGVSHGVFPSLQAERLKKHLKKFAVASPVKSNPKSQKLIAKALEPETASVKGKERRDHPSSAHTSKQSDIWLDAQGQGEPQKAPGKPKNPASARILRKYSNIRGKMQVQQTNVRLKGVPKNLKANRLKRLSTESVSESVVLPPLKTPKIPLPATKTLKTTKILRRKTFARKRVMRRRAAKAQHVSRVTRCSQRLSSVVSLSKSKGAKKTSEEDKDAENGTNAGKCQTNDSLEIRDAPEATLQDVDVKPPSVTDQVLTRSQRKMEAVSKRSKLAKEQAALKLARKAELMGKKGAVKRNLSAVWSRTRSQELLATPVKRTRTSR
ncbi:serine-rich adhesin for platelets isoform X1 [Syngnathus scovelli]|uniref:serine-rich adhesin for platelets isoform X1 n=1 Tax=Syngnathus scovelli TaxID=161590 RepID=UPI00210FEFA8|nr:uncharacterized protein LOC125978626 isoform X1 [Syngnathus scovelli]